MVLPVQTGEVSCDGAVVVEEVPTTRRPASGPRASASGLRPSLAEPRSGNEPSVLRKCLMIWKKHRTHKEVPHFPSVSGYCKKEYDQLRPRFSWKREPRAMGTLGDKVLKSLWELPPRPWRKADVEPTHPQEARTPAPWTTEKESLLYPLSSKQLPSVFKETRADDTYIPLNWMPTRCRLCTRNFAHCGLTRSSRAARRQV